MIEKGFYYHYKHDPAKGVFDAAYEIVGSAFSTESGGNVHSDNVNDFLADEVVVYRPLFEDALVYKQGKRFWIRPASMFLEEVEKDGAKMTRFIKINDPAVIAGLEEKKRQMYDCA